MPWVGQVLHLLGDLSLAADNAVFGQTGPKVGSFDGGFGVGFWPVSLASARHGKSGFSAAATEPKRLSRWVW